MIAAAADSGLRLGYRPRSSILTAHLLTHSKSQVGPSHLSSFLSPPKRVTLWQTEPLVLVNVQSRPELTSGELVTSVKVKLGCVCCIRYRMSKVSNVISLLGTSCRPLDALSLLRLPLQALRLPRFLMENSAQRQTAQLVSTYTTDRTFVAREMLILARKLDGVMRNFIRLGMTRY